jgi:hypothetical protein
MVNAAGLGFVRVAALDFKKPSRLSGVRPVFVMETVTAMSMATIGTMSAVETAKHIRPACKGRRARANEWPGARNA